MTKIFLVIYKFFEKITVLKINFCWFSSISKVKCFLTSVKMGCLGRSWAWDQHSVNLSPKNCVSGLKLKFVFRQKFSKIKTLQEIFFYEEIRISFINNSTPKGLTLILVKKNFEKSIKILSESWFQISRPMIIKWLFWRWWVKEVSFATKY